MNNIYAIEDAKFDSPVEEHKLLDKDEGDISEVEKPENTPEVVENEAFHWLKNEDIEDLRSRWNSVQTGFVDQPKHAVELADALVTDVLEQIKQVFIEKKSLLEKHEMNGQEITTEDLRISLQGYRVFLNRLLTL